MEIEVKSQKLKNILTSILATQPEVNIIFSSNPLKIQFITSKFESIMYWALKPEDIIVNKIQENYYHSVTVQIEKVLKVLNTDKTYSCTIIDDKDSTGLVLQQEVEINNCLIGKRYIVGAKQVFKLVIPFIETHHLINEYGYEYNRYKEEFNTTPVVTAIFTIKMFEKMINSSLNVTNEIIFEVSDNNMKFIAVLDESLVISSSLIHRGSKKKSKNVITQSEDSDINEAEYDENVSRKKYNITKHIDIGCLSYIKAYRKISTLLSISVYVSSNSVSTKQVLSIKPISNDSIDTELILYFS